MVLLLRVPIRAQARAHARADHTHDYLVQAGRNHEFLDPPRRLKKLRQWDWVTAHCKASDGWVDKARQVRR